MKKFKKSLGSLESCLMVACLSASSGLQGQGVPLDGELFVSQNGNVSFFEVQFGPDVHYYVDLLAPISLSAAAFSFDVPQFPVIDGPIEDGFPEEEIPRRGGDEPAFSGFTTLGPWGTYFFSEEQWNEGSLVQIANQVVSTSSFGTFDELFGQLDNHVVMFADHQNLAPLTEDSDIDGIPTEDDFPPPFGRSFGLASTEGLFFDNNAAVVATTIPEPSVPMLVGLVTLGSALRRRR